MAAAEALQQWTVNRTGPYISNVLSHVGFARLDEQLVPANDPAAGPNTAHYEFITSVCTCASRGYFCHLTCPTPRRMGFPLLPVRHRATTTPCSSFCSRPNRAAQ